MSKAALLVNGLADSQVNEVQVAADAIGSEDFRSVRAPAANDQVNAPEGATATESEASKMVASADTDIGRSAMVPADESYVLDFAVPLDRQSFPNPPRSAKHPVAATLPNFMHLLNSYDILARYNVVRKKLTITMPGYSGSAENVDSVAMMQIISLATLNGMPTGQLAGFIEAIGDRNQYNPVATWIKSKPWDGVKRLLSLYNTISERDDFPRSLKQKLIYRWLLSAVAAALMPKGFRGRGVLTIQGPQGIGKTAWFSSLVPDAALREELLKLDHHLDASNKDSLISAISHWLVEMGELDSSFKKDLARLKGFLTSDRDKVRRPYGRVESEYPRRTVFYASVNDAKFLVDTTGNTRFWTIPAVAIDFKHGIDMQQVFAELAVDFEAGAQWWLTPEEEALLDEHNKEHRAVSALRERILDKLDLSVKDRTKLTPRTPMDVLACVGIEFPTNSQCKECGGILREFIGEPSRINGRDKWRVPLLDSSGNSLVQPRRTTDAAKADDSELY